MGHGFPPLRRQRQDCVLFISEPSMPSTEPGTCWTLLVHLLNEGRAAGLNSVSGMGGWRKEEAWGHRATAWHIMGGGE